jgi:hypothetical protein
MRPPRMTMRRWMIAAMTIALVLGCYREAIRLKQKRAVCLMRATWHAGEEAYHRRLSLSQLSQTDLRGEADQEPTPSPTPSAEPDKAIELVFQLPPERSDRSEGHDRFRAAQARQYALADRTRKLADDFRREQSKYHATQADYHAMLARKYQAAASHPWLPVEPDPPPPRLSVMPGQEDSGGN